MKWSCDVPMGEIHGAVNVLSLRALSDFGLRRAWMSEVEGNVILDQGGVRFRPRSDGF